MAHMLVKAYVCDTERVSDRGEREKFKEPTLCNAYVLLSIEKRLPSILLCFTRILQEAAGLCNKGKNPHRTEKKKKE